MRTLDEVIKAYEQCAKSDWEEGCGDCAYRNEKCGSCKCVRNDDALHYLRELKLFRQTPTMQGIHKAQKECALYPVGNWGEDEPDFNPPLSWEGLKGMEGKPVWVEQCNGDTKGWLLILRANYDVINCTTKHGNSFYLYKSSYGEKWQAYRKERS